MSSATLSTPASQKQSPDDIVFVAAKRTPFGAFGGTLKDFSATDLAVFAAKAALKDSQIAPELIDHVIFGNVIQSSPDAAYLARHVGLRCGVPIPTPAVTVNRLCGSGFEAIQDGVRRIQLNEASTVLVGGTESMSQVPFVLRGARFGQRLGHGELEDALMAGLTDSYVKLPMALTAENLAVKYGLTRNDCDTFALQSQTKTAKAKKAGHFTKELAPIELSLKGQVTLFDKDEHARENATLEGLAKLKPVFKKDGVVSAGNASGMVDGAAALVLTRRRIAQQKGWNILGRWVAGTEVGCDPSIMGIGPVMAIQSLLRKTGRSLNDISLIEINEAFAPQVLAVQRELNLPGDRLNVDGGAIAIGHPLGASGARLVTHLLHRLSSSRGLGLASACIGGGQGTAVLVEVE